MTLVIDSFGLQANVMVFCNTLVPFGSNLSKYLHSWKGLTYLSLSRMHFICYGLHVLQVTGQNLLTLERLHISFIVEQDL